MLFHFYRNLLVLPENENRLVSVAPITECHMGRVEVRGRSKQYTGLVFIFTGLYTFKDGGSITTYLEILLVCYMDGGHESKAV